MSELTFEAAGHAELAHAQCAFGPGVHVVLGHERDGTGALIALAAGLRPTKGRVALNGAAIWCHAESRRQIAALCAQEPLLPGKTVLRSVELSLRARSDAQSAQTVLDGAGLSWLAARRSASISAQEARAVACAVALAHPRATLLALHEPLALAGVLNDAFVLEALRQRVEVGAIVLCSASRLEDAARLGGSRGVIERGVYLDDAALRLPVGEVTLRVQTPEPRRLAARLSETPNISAVEWAGGTELLVRGTDFEQLSQSVVANARAEAIRITALRQDAPPLEVLAATRAGLAQAYYARAYGTQVAQ